MPRIFVFCYLVAVSLLAFIVGWYDKMCARKRRRRIPERTLFALAFLGGAPGLYAAMLIFRHKTRHKRFMVGVPFIALGWAALVALLWPHLP